MTSSLFWKNSQVMMPDHSYPGVYVEEFGPAKAIASVATFIVGVLVGVAFRWRSTGCVANASKPRLANAGRSS